MDAHALAHQLLHEPTAERDERLAAIAGTTSARSLAWALWEVSGSAWTHEPRCIEEAADCVGLLALWHGDAELAALRDWMQGVTALVQGQPAQARRLLQKAGSTFTLLADDHHAAQVLVPLMVAQATLGEHGAATDTAAMLVDRLARCSRGYHADIAALATARALAWKADLDAARRRLYQPPASPLRGP
jgi:hypothetical protein